MSTDRLEQAIALIQEDNLLDAQKILEEMLAANPQNLTAWNWYVRTYPKGEKRIKALKLCLKYNPDNQTVKEMLKRLDTEIIRPKSFTSILFDRLLAIVYFAVTLLFIGELVFAWKNLSKYPGFDGMFFLILWLAVLTPQWLVLCVVPMYYVVSREKNTAIKSWALKTSKVVTILLMAGELGFTLLNTPHETVQDFIPGFVFGTLILLAPEFISSIGIAAFLFLAFNTGKWPDIKEKAASKFENDDVSV